MLSSLARQGVGRTVTAVIATVALVAGILVTSASSASAADPVATTTTLKLNADGTGTVEVTAAGGVTPTSVVDLWIDGTYQKAYALTNGKAAIDVGTQAHGDHQIYARYREDSTTNASDTVVYWTAPGTVQSPTTTTLKLNADGTGTVEVKADNGVNPTNPVDLWIDGIWQKGYELTDGKADIDLGTQPHGDHHIYARYRENSTTKSSETSVVWTAPGTVQSPTTTTLKLNADGTGTVEVKADNGVTPTNAVDLWIDGVWQKAYTLTAGKAAIDLGTQAHGDHQIYARYRENSTTKSSETSVVWTAPGTVQSPTTTTLKLNADGTGTVEVKADNGVTPTNVVDLWIDGTWQKGYTLTNGKAAIDLGTQSPGDHQVYARYRENSTTKSSETITTWTAPGTVQSPTTTTLKLNADGTGTIEVVAENGVTPTEVVDVWIDWTWQKAYALTNGKAAINLGTQAHGDHVIYVRYRGNSTTKASEAGAYWTAPGTVKAATTTTLKLNADGTGTVEVVAENGVTPTQVVDLWIDSIWQKAYTLTNGKAAIDLGTQPHGDHQIYARYRENSTTKASDAITYWTAPGTIKATTTTTLKLNADGTGTVEVKADNGVIPTNPVDLWIDGVWQKAYTLTDGKGAINLGTQPHGDHQIYARYRENSTTKASDAITYWTAPGTIKATTTTTLKLNADGTGTVEVKADNGVTPTQAVDLWINSTWQKGYELTNGKAAINLGTQPLGDHQIYVRYRGDGTTKASDASATWTAPGTIKAPTTTILKLNADGTGTVEVKADNGAVPTNPVDLWIDGTSQKAYTLTNGKATINLGTQPLGDHHIYARYRGDGATKPSDANVIWTAPGTIKAPTTTTLKMNADGTGTVEVKAEGGVVPTSVVDLWIDSTWQKAYALTNGKATINVGSLPGGDYQIYVRYRENGTTKASDAVTNFSVTTADQVPTKTTVMVTPDGTGTITVTAEGKTATNPVDVWLDGKHQGTYTLTDGKATLALGSRPGGEVLVLARYRPSSTDQASEATTIWSVDTAPVPDPTECGAPILKANGEAWKCTFADDFNGATLDRTKWTPQEIFGSGVNEVACYVDSPENISVSGGSLHLTLLKGEPKPCAGHDNAITPYRAGMVSTFHTWSQKYGRFEARIKNTATTASGLHEAFWMWPDERYPEGQGEWPNNGEIDIAETYSNHPGLIVPFLHTVLDLLGSILTGTNMNTTWTCEAERGVYNTYTLEWSPSRLEIFVNGDSCLVNTSGDPAFNKRYIMAFTQALGSEGNELNANTPLPATMSIDYVHAWS